MEKETPTPLMDAYQERLASLDKDKLYTDVSKLEIGDMVNLHRHPQKGGGQGFVKSIGPKNIVLEMPYGGYGGADYIEIMEIKRGKDEVKEFLKPKKEGLMTKEDILKLDSKKHVKIWLLYKLGLSRREIAEALGTNPGHVGNEIKAYEKNPDKKKAAEVLGEVEDSVKTIKSNKNENKKEISIEEAISYLSRGLDSAEKEQPKGSIERLAYKLAKEKNKWFNSIDSLPPPAPGGGNENSLYYNENTGEIYKSNNLFNHGLSVLNYLRYLLLHNNVFENTKYKLAGFTGLDNGYDKNQNATPYIEPVVSQKYILGEHPSVLEIENHMVSIGFEKVNDDTYKNKDYVVSDLKPRNVIKGKDGKIYVIDNIIKENKTQLSKGGVLVGAKHGSGGIDVKTPIGKIEVEGGEVIVNAVAAKENCEELSKINQSAGDGVAFPCDHSALDGVQGPMNGKGAKLTYGGKIGAKNTEGVKWFKDKDGRERFEINDSDAVVNINDIIRFSVSSEKQNNTISVFLSDIVTVWSGYINYPDLRNVKLVFIPNGNSDGALYTYWPDLDLIFVNSKYITNEITNKNSEREKGVRLGGVHENVTRGTKGVSNNLSGKFGREIRKRLFHEIQHPIQKREGIEITPSDDDAIIYALKQKHGKPNMEDSEFIKWIEEHTGDNYKYIKSDFYKTIPSEYEALDVEKRAFYTKKERESEPAAIQMKRARLGDKITEGIEVEKEHTDLYNELSGRLEAEGHKMPMSQHEFFKMISAAHIKERGDYYPLLKKYVEHAPSLMDKPYFLLTKEEVISCRDFIEMREAAGIPPTAKCAQRIKDLARYAMVNFKTLLKDLK